MDRYLGWKTIGLVAAVLTPIAVNPASFAQGGDPKRETKPTLKREMTPAPTFPAPLSTDDQDVVPTPFGEPLRIMVGDEVARTIYMYKGRTVKDAEKEGVVTYYHGLLPVARVNPAPPPDFPSVVHRVTTRGQDVAVELHFRISSAEMRKACLAALSEGKSVLRTFGGKGPAKVSPTEKAAAEYVSTQAFGGKGKGPAKVPPTDKGAAERVSSQTFGGKGSGNASPKIRVERMPVRELFVAINDSVTGRTLAYNSRNVRGEGDVVKMWLEFDRENLDQFKALWKKNEVEFVFACLVNGQHMIFGRQTTKVDYTVGLHVSQELTSEQKTDGAPILQGDVTRIARSVAAKIQREIVADDEAVVKLFQSDALLLADVFDPAKSLSVGDFQKAFPGYSAQVLATYLQPLLQSKYESMSRSDVTTTGGSVEVTTTEGGGFELNLPILSNLGVGFGDTDENRTRTLNSWSQSTGVTWTKGSKENSYKPHQIRVFKLASGYEKKTYVQSMTVALGKGKVREYIRDAAVPQTITEELLSKSFQGTAKTMDWDRPQPPPRPFRPRLVTSEPFSYGKEKERVVVSAGSVKHPDYGTILCRPEGGGKKGAKGDVLWRDSWKGPGDGAVQSLSLGVNLIIVRCESGRVLVYDKNGKRLKDTGETRTP